MTAFHQPDGTAILYVASRLPELSETFVYRELFGLRARGLDVVGSSIRPPRRIADDPAMSVLADEVTIVYSLRTAMAMSAAFVRRPMAFGRALVDALQADHVGVKSRLKHLFQACMGLALGWRLRKRGIGHVHAHMANVPATVALYAARALHARFSFTGHAADLFVQRAGLRFKLEQADFVSSISGWHQQFYRQIAGIEQDRAPLIRCSVALPQGNFALSKEVVTVARLVPKKGVDLLIGAFAAAALPGWRLRILGDGPERARLEALTDQLGLRGSVTFEGARSHRECLDAIARSGMFVLPCRTAANGDKDGIPVVLMEAMAASRAVIGGDLPTIRELISDGETGLLVQPDDPAALAAAMRRVAADDAFATAMGVSARTWIEREFSDRVNLDRLCSALGKAASPA
jgi:glycosyltransferase involved in cell wall biosynthesis